MADTKRLRRYGSRAAVGFAGLMLGLALAGPAFAAEPPTTSSSTSSSTSTSTSSTSTSTSTSTTTSTTVAPPPPTSPVTSTVIPPLVQDSGSRSEIGDSRTLDRIQRVRRAQASPSSAAATGPELPFTGNGTLAVFGSGLAALLLGALALWWGSRDHQEIDTPGSEATG